MILSLGRSEEIFLQEGIGQAEKKKKNYDRKYICVHIVKWKEYIYGYVYRRKIMSDFYCSSQYKDDKRKCMTSTGSIRAIFYCIGFSGESILDFFVIILSDLITFCQQ